MARHNDDRLQLLKILEETPFLNAACKKVGIARATVYRWMDSNLDFKKNVQKALKEGRHNGVEIAEVMLLKKVREGDMSAIRFLLQFNTKKYRQTRAAPPPPLVSPEHWQMFTEVYMYILQNKPIPREELERILLTYHRWKLLDDDGNPTPKLNEVFKSVKDNIGDLNPKDAFDRINKRREKRLNNHDIPT